MDSYSENMLLVNFFPQKISSSMLLCTDLLSPITWMGRVQLQTKRKWKEKKMKEIQVSLHKFSRSQIVKMGPTDTYRKKPCSTHKLAEHASSPKRIASAMQNLLIVY